MGIFDIFKRSRREINRSNQEQGKAGEEQVKAKYEFNGYKVTRTGKGHDYRATKKNWWTGKRETKYVEVKTGNSKLSPLQRKKKKQLGSKYVEERVNSNPFMGYGGNISPSTNQHTKRKKKTRSSNKSILGTIFGSSTPKKQKSKKSSDILWGSGSNVDIWGNSKSKSRKKKSSSDSIWGSGSNVDIWGNSSDRKRKRKSDSIW